MDQRAQQIDVASRMVATYGLSLGSVREEDLQLELSPSYRRKYWAKDEKTNVLYYIEYNTVTAKLYTWYNCITTEEDRVIRDAVHIARKITECVNSE